MTNTISNIIQYFHDCYQADNRELILYDFLDRKIENKLELEGKEELLTNESPKIPIDSTKAKNTLKKLELFEKEKELLYGAFFICGQYLDFKGNTKRLFAPLFYYPAEISEENDFHYLSIRVDERKLNYPLFQLLSKDNSETFLEDPLFQKLPKSYIDFGDIGTIVKLCEKHFTEVNCEHTYLYPDNLNIKTVKNSLSKISKKKDYYELLPTSMVGLVSKSSNTRGVLNELKTLSSESDYSLPLRSLLNPETTIKERKYTKGTVPTILSQAQQKLLKSSSTNPITLIVGPPGTGKTYTIGAIAIEHMSRGESVLIASRTNEAVDVISEKIKSQLGIDKCVVRGGRKRAYTTPLNRFLKGLITRVQKLNYLLKEFEIIDEITDSNLASFTKKLKTDVDKRHQTITKLEKDFLKEVSKEISWGNDLSKTPQNSWQKLNKAYIKLLNRLQKPVWSHSMELRNLDKDQIVAIKEKIKLEYVHQLLKSIDKHWKEIKDFHEAIKTSSDTERLKKFESIDFNIILKAFPIWMTSLADIKELIPLQKEIFDVVIIDEATQCDIASCIPLIQRAKRVVFAGDPNQLRHISFLSTGRQYLFQSKHNLQNTKTISLDYRNKSILDSVIESLHSNKQLAMLDEHFRSLPPIIDFSNKHFYGKELKIMTSKPDETQQALYFIDCNGVREKNGSNPIEAQQIIKDIRTHINSETESPNILKLGILSPFKAQVDLLTKLLLENFSLKEIEKHAIRVGTAYSFQGEEREIMYLSMVVDPNTHHSSFIHLNKEDVFNVSITRARQRQYVYVSIDVKDLKTDSLLRGYISSSNSIQKKLRNPEDDIFLNEVVSILESWNFNTYWKAYNIAGTTIDLLLKHNNQYIGIDLIGYPGEFSNIFGLNKYRLLNRADIKVFSLPYSNWLFEKEETQTILKEFIEGYS